MYIGKTRSPIVVILLSIVTCGIYMFVWAYSVANDINKVVGKEQISPVLFLVSFFIPYLPLYGYYQLDQGFVKVSQSENLQYESKFILWLVLMLVGLGYLIACFQTQETLNKIWENRGGGAPA